MKLHVGTVLCAAGIALLSGCETTEYSVLDEVAVAEAPSAAAVKIIYVAPAMADCTGVGPMTCLMVKETPTGEYQMFHNSIKDFDYVPGYEYTLEVRLVELDGVPADASTIRYELIEELSKEPAGLSLTSQGWDLKTYLSVSGTLDPKVHNSQSWFKISEGKMNGNAGANRFFGEAKVDGSSFSVSAVGSTMMMGTPELMAQEQQVLKHFGEAADYLIVGDELRVRNGEGAVTMTFAPRKDMSLTGVEWNATGINNGTGGVASLAAGSKVFIQFSEEGTVSGSAGCNRFSGPYNLSGDALEIGPLMTTKMMCSEPAGVMEQEANFLQALGNARALLIDGQKLELRDADGALQVGFAADAQ